MIKFFTAALAAISILLPTSSQARTLKVDESRAVYLVGEIAGNVLDVAAKIVDLSAKSTLPIYMVINSPGGQVFAGLQVISAMHIAKARGVTIKCFVPVMAASMAFTILANCDQRYVLEQTLLLWHPVKIGVMGTLDSDQLLYEGGQLRSFEKIWNPWLIRKLGISAKLFYYNYRHETLWTAQQLLTVSPSFVRVVDDFSGVNRPFDLGL